MVLETGLQASLGGTVAWIGVDLVSLITLAGSAMLLATIGVMVFLALGPFVSSKWADELAATNDGSANGSTEATAGSSD